MQNQNNFQNGQSNVQAQPFYQNGDRGINQPSGQQDDKRDAEQNGFLNGVYMSDFVNIGADGTITHDKGPTFKELKERANNGNGKRRIVAKKMYKNAIEEVKLDDGTTMDIDTAVEFAKEFGFDNVNVGRARSGRQILRANPTDDPQKALRNLPTYE